MNNIKGHIITKIFSCILLVMFLVVFCDIRKYAYADDAYVGFKGDISQFYKMDDVNYISTVDDYLSGIGGDRSGEISFDKAHFVGHDIELRVSGSDAVGAGMSINNIAGAPAGWWGHFKWWAGGTWDWICGGVTRIGGFVINDLVIPFVSFVWNGALDIGYIFVVALTDISIFLFSSTLDLIGGILNLVGLGAGWDVLSPSLLLGFEWLLMGGQDTLLNIGRSIKGGAEFTVEWIRGNIKQIAILIAAILVIIAAIIIIVVGVVLSWLGVGLLLIALGLILLGAAAVLYGFGTMDFSETFLEGSFIEGWQAGALNIAPIIAKIGLLLVAAGLIFVAASVILVMLPALFGGATILSVLGSLAVFKVIGTIFLGAAITCFGAAGVMYSIGEGLLSNLGLKGDIANNLQKFCKKNAFNALTIGVAFLGMAMVCFAIPLFLSSFSGLGALTSLAGIKGAAAALLTLSGWKALVLGFLSCVGGIAAVTGGLMFAGGGITAYACLNLDGRVAKIWWGADMQSGIVGAVTSLTEFFIGTAVTSHGLEGGIGGWLFNAQKWAFSGFGGFLGNVPILGWIIRGIGFLAAAVLCGFEMIVTVIGVGLQIAMVGHQMSMIGMGWEMKFNEAGGSWWEQTGNTSWLDVPKTMVEGLLQFIIDTFVVYLNPWNENFRPGFGLGNLAIIVGGGAKGAGTMAGLFGKAFKISSVASTVGKFKLVVGLKGYITGIGLKGGTLLAKLKGANIVGSLLSNPVLVKFAAVGVVLVLTYPIIEAFFGNQFADIFMMGVPLMMVTHKGGELFKGKLEGGRFGAIEVKIEGPKAKQIFESMLDVFRKEEGKEIKMLDILGNERTVKITQSLKKYVGKELCKQMSFKELCELKLGDLKVFKGLDFKNMDVSGLNLAKLFEMKMAEGISWGQIKKLIDGKKFKFEGFEISGSVLANMKMDLKNVVTAKLVKEMSFSKTSFEKMFDFIKKKENSKMFESLKMDTAKLKMDVVMTKLAELDIRALNKLKNGKDIKGVTMEFLRKKLGREISMKDIIDLKIGRLDEIELGVLFDGGKVDGISLKSLESCLNIKISPKEVIHLKFSEFTGAELEMFMDGKMVRGLAAKSLAKALKMDVKDLKMEVLKKCVLDNFGTGKDMIAFLKGEFKIRIKGKEMDMNALIKETGIKKADLQLEILKKEWKEMVKEGVGLNIIEGTLKEIGLKLNAKEMQSLKVELFQTKLIEMVKNGKDIKNMEVLAKDFGLELLVKDKKVMDNIRMETVKSKVIMEIKGSNTGINLKDFTDVKINKIAKELFGSEFKLEASAMKNIKIEILKLRLMEICKDGKKVRNIKGIAEEFGLKLKDAEIKDIKLKVFESLLREAVKDKKLEITDNLAIRKLAKEKLGLELKTEQINSLQYKFKLESFKAEFLDIKFSENFRGDFFSFLNGDIKLDGMDIKTLAENMGMKVDTLKMQIILELVGDVKIGEFLNGKCSLKIGGKKFMVKELAENMGWPEVKANQFKAELAKAEILKMEIKNSKDVAVFSELKKFMDDASLDTKVIAETKIKQMFSAMEMKDVIKLLEKKDMEGNQFGGIIKQLSEAAGIKAELNKILKESFCERVAKGDIAAVEYVSKVLFEGKTENVKIKELQKVFSQEMKRVNGLDIKMTPEFKKALVENIFKDSGNGGFSSAMKQKLAEIILTKDGDMALGILGKEMMVFKKSSIFKELLKEEGKIEFNKALKKELKLEIDRSSLSESLKTELKKFIDESINEKGLKEKLSKRFKEDIDVIEFKDLPVESLKTKIAEKVSANKNNEFKDISLKAKESAEVIKCEQKASQLKNELPGKYLEVETAKKNGNYKLADQKWKEYKKMENQMIVMDALVSGRKRIDGLKENLEFKRGEKTETMIEVLEAEIKLEKIHLEIVRCRAKKLGVDAISPSKNMLRLKEQHKTALKDYRSCKDKLETEIQGTEARFEKLDIDVRESIINAANNGVRDPNKLLDVKGIDKAIIKGITETDLLIIKSQYVIKGKFAKLSGQMRKLTQKEFETSQKKLDIINEAAKDPKNPNYFKKNSPEIEIGNSGKKIKITSKTDLADINLLFEQNFLYQRGLLFHLLSAKDLFIELKGQISELKKESKLSSEQQVKLKTLIEMKDNTKIRVETVKSSIKDIYGEGNLKKWTDFKNKQNEIRTKMEGFMASKTNALKRGELFGKEGFEAGYKNMCKEVTGLELGKIDANTKLSLDVILVETVMSGFAKNSKQWNGKLDMVKFHQQRSMIAELLRDNTVAVGTGVGKTIGFELEIAIRSLVKKEDMQAMLIVEKSSAIMKTVEGTMDGQSLYHQKFMENFGLKLVNGDQLRLEGVGKLTEALNNPNQVVIFSKDAFGHLFNMVESAELMRALKKQNVVRFDEVHMPLTEQMSYIIGGQNSRPLTAKECRGIIKSYEQIDRLKMKEVREIPGMEKVTDMKKINEKLETTKEFCYYKNAKAKDFHLSNEAIKKIKEIAKDNEIELSEIHSILSVEFFGEKTFSVVGKKRSAEAIKAGRVEGDIIPWSGGKAEYSQIISDPARLVASAYKNTKLKNAKLKIGEQITVDGVMKDYNLQVSKTKMQSSISEAMQRKTGASYAGGTGTIRTAKELHAFQIGKETIDISGSYLDFKKVKEIKEVKDFLNRDGTINEVNVKKFVKEMLDSYKNEKRPDLDPARNKIIGINDPMLYEIVQKALKKELGEKKYNEIVKEIGPETSEIRINKFAELSKKEGQIILTNERGLIGVDFKGNIDLHIIGVEKFTADLLIQAMGRIRRNKADKGDIFFYLDRGEAANVMNSFKTKDGIKLEGEITKSITSMETKMKSELMTEIGEITALQQMIVKSEGLKFQIKESLWHKNAIMTIKDLIGYYEMNKKFTEAKIAREFLKEALQIKKNNEVNFKMKELTSGKEYIKQTVEGTGGTIRNLLEDLSNRKGLDSHGKTHLGRKIAEIDKLLTRDKDGKMKINSEAYEVLKFEKGESFSFAEATTFIDMVTISKNFERNILESRINSVQNRAQTVRVERAANKVRIEVESKANIADVATKVDVMLADGKINNIAVLMSERMAIGNHAQLIEWYNTAREKGIALNIVVNTLDGQQRLWTPVINNANNQQITWKSPEVKEIYKEGFINPLLNSKEGNIPFMNPTIQSHQVKTLTFSEKMLNLNEVSKMNFAKETNVFKGLESKTLLGELQNSRNRKIVIRVPSNNGKEIATKIVDDLNVYLYFVAKNKKIPVEQVMKELEIRPFSIVDANGMTIYTTALAKIGIIEGIEVISVTGKQLNSWIDFAVLKRSLSDYAKTADNAVDIKRIVVNVPKGITNEKLIILKSTLESTGKNYAIVWGKTAKTREIAIVKEGGVEIPCINDPKLQAWIEKPLVERALNLNQQGEMAIKRIEQKQTMPSLPKIHEQIREQMQQKPLHFKPHIVPGVNFGIPFTKLKGALQIRQGILQTEGKAYTYNVIRIKSLTAENIKEVKTQIKQIADNSDYINIELPAANKGLNKELGSWVIKEIGNNRVERTVNLVVDGKVFTNQMSVRGNEFIETQIAKEVDMVFNLPQAVSGTMTKVSGFEHIIGINKKIEIRVIDQQEGVYAFDLSRVDNSVELNKIATEITKTNLPVKKVILRTGEMNQEIIKNEIASSLCAKNVDVTTIVGRSEVYNSNGRFKALSRSEKEVFIKQIESEFLSDKQIEWTAKDEVVVAVLGEGINRAVDVRLAQRLESEGLIIDVISPEKGVAAVSVKGENFDFKVMKNVLDIPARDIIVDISNMNKGQRQKVQDMMVNMGKNDMDRRITLIDSSKSGSEGIINTNNPNINKLKVNSNRKAEIFVRQIKDGLGKREIALMVEDRIKVQEMTAAISKTPEDIQSPVVGGITYNNNVVADAAMAGVMGGVPAFVNWNDLGPLLLGRKASINGLKIGDKISMDKVNTAIKQMMKDNQERINAGVIQRLVRTSLGEQKSDIVKTARAILKELPVERQSEVLQMARMIDISQNRFINPHLKAVAEVFGMDVVLLDNKKTFKKQIKEKIEPRNDNKPLVVTIKGERGKTYQQLNDRVNKLENELTGNQGYGYMSRSFEGGLVIGNNPIIISDINNIGVEVLSGLQRNIEIAAEKGYKLDSIKIKAVKGESSPKQIMSMLRRDLIRAGMTFVNSRLGNKNVIVVSGITQKNVDSFAYNAQKEGVPNLVNVRIPERMNNKAIPPSPKLPDVGELTPRMITDRKDFKNPHIPDLLSLKGITEIIGSN